LVDNFLLLYLKKYDKILNEQEKKIRNNCEKIIVGISATGSLSSIYLLSSKISIF
jgi:hypothetical protein